MNLVRAMHIDQVTIRSDICKENRLVQGIFEEHHSFSFRIVKRKERTVSGSGLLVYFFK